MVVIEESQSATFGFDDGSFMVDTAPHIRNREPCLLSYIHKLDRRCRWGRDGGLQQILVPPSPKRSRKSFCQVAAEEKER